MKKLRDSSYVTTNKNGFPTKADRRFSASSIIMCVPLNFYLMCLILPRSVPAPTDNDAVSFSANIIIPDDLYYIVPSLLVLLTLNKYWQDADLFCSKVNKEIIET